MNLYINDQGMPLISMSLENAFNLRKKKEQLKTLAVLQVVEISLLA